MINRGASTYETVMAGRLQFSKEKPSISFEFTLATSDAGVAPANTPIPRRQAVTESTQIRHRAGGARPGGARHHPLWVWLNPNRRLTAARSISIRDSSRRSTRLRSSNSDRAFVLPFVASVWLKRDFFTDKLPPPRMSHDRDDTKHPHQVSIRISADINTCVYESPHRP
jgi:hypothetical protein